MSMISCGKGWLELSRLDTSWWAGRRNCCRGRHRGQRGRYHLCADGHRRGRRPL